MPIRTKEEILNDIDKATDDGTTGARAAMEVALDIRDAIIRISKGVSEVQTQLMDIASSARWKR